MKKCQKCGKIKSLSEYYLDKSRPDGLNYCCKKCINAKSVIYRRKNKNKLRIAAKIYRDQNPKKMKAQSQKYRQNRPHRCWAITTLINHRKYKIQISNEALEKIAKQTTYCSICGCELQWGYGKKDGKPQLNSPSLDRINNDDIISKDTIQIICHRCNSGKLQDTNEEFIRYCVKVSYNNFLKPINIKQNSANLIQ